MELHLVDNNADVVNAWRKAFRGFNSVVIRHGDIVKLADDTLVSPANCYGYMDGGIDRIYRDFFRRENILIEHLVQQAIAATQQPYLPIGDSLLITTTHTRITRLIVAPTMFLPERIKPEKCFLAMAAVLHCVDRNRDAIGKVFCPGLGTGIGEVDPDDSATQMAKAFRLWLEGCLPQTA